MITLFTFFCVNIIMNKSMAEGILPQGWKEAYVSPIYKTILTVGTIDQSASPAQFSKY